MSQADSLLHDSCLPRRHRVGHFTNRELATIAVLAALHFAVSFAARMIGGVLQVLLGPWAVFVDGLGGEGIPCLLSAVAVTLIPRFGTATLMIVTVWLLNAVVSGTFSFVSAQQVAVSIIVHEAILLLFLVTVGPWRRRPSRMAAISEIVRTSLALGVANATALGVQFYIAINEYKLIFPRYYVEQVTLITGLGYGALGAAIGTVWGRSLRRTAP
ncbi:MAG: hypothetical protein QM775_19100 [Pirellulales bacterium]